MTLTSLLTDFYQRAGYDATPSAALTTRATSYLNEIYHQILSRKGLSKLRRTVQTVATVADYEFVALPSSVTRATAAAREGGNIPWPR